MKFIFKAWFSVGGLLLWLYDVLRGTVFSTSSDCAGDPDGQKALASQMKCDRATGVVASVATTAELAHMILRDLQIATQNGKPAVIHGNIAHRDENGNGAGFCVARIGRSWVIATEGGYTWSAFRLFDLVDKVFRLNWEECIDYLFNKGLINKKAYGELYDTQFRSLKLSWLLRFYRLGFKLPGQWVKINEVSIDLAEFWRRHNKLVVGYRDVFHNTYLLATKEMTRVELGDSYFLESQCSSRLVRFVHRLKDVPKGHLCLVEVSAGFGGRSLLGVEAKASPDEKGVWPDPAEDWHSGFELCLTPSAATQTKRIQRQRT